MVTVTDTGWQPRTIKQNKDRRIKITDITLTTSNQVITIINDVFANEGSIFLSNQNTTNNATFKIYGTLYTADEAGNPISNPENWKQIGNDITLGVAGPTTPTTELQRFEGGYVMIAITGVSSGTNNNTKVLVYVWER